MADTIKTGTTPGSLQFQREPWTPFYMAGEIIRESRKASGKQREQGSEGNMAHANIVIDHYDHPRGVGKGEAPQKEVERQKKEADKLEFARQTNRNTFGP